MRQRRKNRKMKGRKMEVEGNKKKARKQRERIAK